MTADLLQFIKVLPERLRDLIGNRELVVIEGAVVLLIVAVSVTTALDPHWLPYSEILINVLALVIGLSVGAMSYSSLSRKAAPRVFVSFSYEDIEFVTSLVERLRKEGIDVLNPAETIRVGDNIRLRLRDLIRQSSHAIVVVSPKYEESKWQQMEFAMMQGQVRIVPILYRTEEIPNGMEEMRYLQVTELTDEVVAELIPSLPIREKTT